MLQSLSRVFNRPGVIFLISTIITLLVTAIFSFTPVSDTLAAAPVKSSNSDSFKARLVVGAPGPFYIGDPIPIELIIEGVSEADYLLPKFDSSNGLELVSKEKLKKEQIQGGWRHIVNYQLVGWKAGDYTISGLSISYQNKTGLKGTIFLEPLPVKITSLLPTNLSEEEILAEGLKDLKKPVGLPARYQYFWFILGGLGLLALMGWVVKRWRCRQAIVNSQAEEEAAIAEPAHLVALRRLEDLQQKQLLEQGEYKRFYDQLSEIAREYIEKRFQIRALEMTTEEFLMGMAEESFLNHVQKAALGEFLQHSDLVKFAKHQPLYEEGDRAFGIIRNLVEETKVTEATLETVAI